MKTIMEGFHRAHKNFPEGGTCLEFGVFRGNTYMAQVGAILAQYPTTSIIGFDSWQGLPEETGGVWRPDRHAKGQFKIPRNVVEKRLADEGVLGDPRFTLVDGFFKDTLTAERQASIDNLIFVNVDVDIHSSSMELLDFIYPLLQPGTVLYFDDWKDPKDTYDGKWGEHLAWEQFTEQHPDLKHETFVVNQWNQRCIEIG